MRRSDGRVCGSGDFFLGKGSRHDFGPSTIQLKDNWRMVIIDLQKVCRPCLFHDTFELTFVATTFRMMN